MKCKLVDPNTCIDKTDAKAVAAHLSTIAQLLQEGFALEAFQIQLLSRIIKDIEETGQYKLPKKHGGQTKDYSLRNSKYTVDVIDLIKQGVKTTAAFEEIASRHCTSPETVRAAYYECRKPVQDMIDNIPEYFYYMKNMEDIFSNYK